MKNFADILKYLKNAIVILHRKKITNLFHTIPVELTRKSISGKNISNDLYQK